MSTSRNPSEEFRRTSTWVYRGYVVLLSVVAIGVAALGWWVDRWWGLAAGTAIGAVILVGGLIAGTLLWAMTQDGG